MFRHQNLQTLWWIRVYIWHESVLQYRHATVRHLICTVEGLGHNIFMDNLFSSPRLFDELDRCKINSCGTVQPNRKEMPCDFGPKQLKLKRGDIRVRTKGGLTTLVWKDRQEFYMLTNMDPTPAEGKICGDSNHPMQPHIMEQCNRLWPAAIQSQRTFEWTKKLFLHLLDLTGLNSWIHLHARLNIPIEISGSFWWGIWLKMLAKANAAPPPNWLEDQG